MSVRNLKPDPVMDIMLKSGKIFRGCDITDKPFGDNERIVMFWEYDKLRIYPISEISYCEIYNE